jgi:hypothetical protein
MRAAVTTEQLVKNASMRFIVNEKNESRNAYYGTSTPSPYLVGYHEEEGNKKIAQMAAKYV